MTVSTLARTDTLGAALYRYRAWIYGAAIFAGTWMVYALLTQDGPGLQHHVYLARAMLSGSFDVGDAGMPARYNDTIWVDDSRYVPFPPGPAILLMPFVAIWGTGFSELQFTAALGAVNVVLLWLVLRKLELSARTQTLATVFFAFGTVHLYCATTGNVWQYNHVATVFFLLMAILLLLNRMPLVLVALAFGFAVISRPPVLMAAPFFLYYAYREHEGKLSVRGLTDRRTLSEVAQFCAGLVPFGLLTLAYNYARFDNPFDSGYQTVYESYIQGTKAYSYLRHVAPDAPQFGLFDVRNIPLHIHALFLLTPDLRGDWLLFSPSKYGMSVLLTSPAFVYAFLVRRATALKPACWLAIGLVALVLFMHYSQGWVQFGYRFLLDFAPFLLVLTALGMEDNQSPGSRRAQTMLVGFSVLVCAWGLMWTRHGW